MKTSISITLFLALLFLSGASSAQTGLRLNGIQMTIPSGSILMMDGGQNGNISFATENSTDPGINLSGTIKLEGHWTNNTASTIGLSGGEVIFNGNNVQDISGTDYTEFYDLTVASGSQTEVPAGHYLTVNHNLSINGSLTLKSGANTATASLLDGAASGGSNSGNLTVEKYIEGSTEYHYVSSPVHNAPLSSIHDTANGNYNIYWYDESDPDSSQNAGWIRIATGNLLDARGYAAIYTNHTTRVFESNLNTASDIDIAVSNTSSGNATADGWNLIGNPFPSPIEAGNFLADNTVLDGTLYLWDDDGSGSDSFSTSEYASYNGIGGTAATGGGTGNTPNGTLAIGQAFFVKKTNAGTANVSFKNSYRTHSTSSQFFISAPQNIQRFKMSVSNKKGLYNEILIGFLEEATHGHDRLYDGHKLKGNPNISLYTLGNEDEYAIQGLPWLEEGQYEKVPLGLDISYSGTYYFNVVSIDQFDPSTSIYLEDKASNTMTDLRSNTSYTFDANSGHINDRFVLHFNPEINSGIENEQANEVEFYSSGNSIYFYAGSKFKGHLSLYDLLGHLIDEKDLDFDGHYQIKTQLAKGTYLAVLRSQGRQQVNRLFIH